MWDEGSKFLLMDGRTDWGRMVQKWCRWTCSRWYVCSSTIAKCLCMALTPDKAPLPNITILHTDITLPSTVPLVLDALGGRKADLVVCDGAPDGSSSRVQPPSSADTKTVTGVHDLDAYLHSQLLLAVSLGPYPACS